MVTVVVIVVVSGALIVGAAWGIYGSLPERLEGFVVALAGCALIISVVLERVQESVGRGSTGLLPTRTAGIPTMS